MPPIYDPNATPTQRQAPTHLLSYKSLRTTPLGGHLAYKKGFPSGTTGSGESTIGVPSSLTTRVTNPHKLAPRAFLRDFHGQLVL
jgi:hypothetical protein